MSFIVSLEFMKLKPLSGTYIKKQPRYELVMVLSVSYEEWKLFIKDRDSLLLLNKEDDL